MPEQTDQPRSLADEPAERGQEPVRCAQLADVLKGRDFMLSSRRLWLLSMALYHGGHPLLARWVKNLNSMLYHNSLPCEVLASPDVRLGHHGVGTVLHPKVVIGQGVKIFQNVTMAVRPTTRPERDRDRGRRGRGRQLGDHDPAPPGHPHRPRGDGSARAPSITHDVPARTIAISAPVEIRPRRERNRDEDFDEDEEG